MVGTVSPTFLDILQALGDLPVHQGLRRESDLAPFDFGFQEVAYIHRHLPAKSWGMTTWYLFLTVTMDMSGLLRVG